MRDLYFFGGVVKICLDAIIIARNATHFYIRNTLYPADYTLYVSEEITYIRLNSVPDPGCTFSLLDPDLGWKKFRKRDKHPG